MARPAASRAESVVLHPFHPIIYVRGFAATTGEIEEAVADPYMGFNLGSTKTRTLWTGELKRFFFESPLVRLMGEYGYGDVFVDGEDLLSLQHSATPIDYRCVIIYRYYDEASESFGQGSTPPIEHFAKGLGELIERLRERVCANKKNRVKPADFRVNLVAHSMGGLICRAFLQNPKLGSTAARAAVDKLYTYATPHGGIDLRIVRNVPAWATFGDASNFNRQRMAEYLGLPAGTDDVSQLKNFPADRVFNLVGTNPGDYRALGGLSAWAAGEASDGLVRIDKATTHGSDSAGNPAPSPHAFVHRSHSGHYGIVNSEEGYQNLVRFLFGALRVDGVLHVDDLSLPQEVEKARLAGRTVRASYQFESVVSVRGAQWQMHRRTVRENSAIFRSYAELFPKGSDAKPSFDRTRSPRLFSAFLDPARSVASSGSVSLAFDVGVLVPDYEVDGALFLKRHFEGGYIYREQILVEAVPDKRAPLGWRVCYGFQQISPGVADTPAALRTLPGGGIAFDLGIAQQRRPGLTGTLTIEVRPWNASRR